MSQSKESSISYSTQIDFTSKGINELVSSYILKKSSLVSVLKGVFLIISSDFLKNIINIVIYDKKKEISEKVISSIPSLFKLHNFKSLIIYIWNLVNISRYFKKKCVSKTLENVEISDLIPESTTVILNIESKHFLENIIQYINTKDTYSKFDIEYNSDIVINDNNQIQYNITYRNIEIPYKDISILINTIFTNDGFSSSQKILSSDDLSYKLLLSNFEYLSNALDKAFDYTPYELGFHASNARAKIISSTNHYTLNVSKYKSFLEEKYSEIDLLEFLFFTFCKLKSMNIIDDLKEICDHSTCDKSREYKKILYYILLQFCSYYDIVDGGKSDNFTFEFRKQNLIKNANLKDTVLPFHFRNILSFHALIPFNVNKKKNLEDFNLLYSIKSLDTKTIHKYTGGDPNLWKKTKMYDTMTVKDTNKSEKIEIVLYSKKYTDKNELIKQFGLFQENLMKSNKLCNVGKTINVNSIFIKETENITTEPNPEYENYLSVKSSLLEKQKDISELELLKTLGQEPPKIINKSNIEKKIVCEKINTRYCSFSNLYLRKAQDIMLYDILESFINDKERLLELGIPNKLGIMLYGEPGTGKTTTITAIATYTGRDIFYLNLNNIKTNSDLKKLFDYVNLQHRGGGIIVLEDIDSMSDIVFKRTSDTKVTQTGDDILTYEYLLNLLDGSLTYDDSVVIITTNHIEKLDEALYRSGRMDKCIEMLKCDRYQISKIYKRFIQRDLSSDVLEKIKEDKYTPADIIFHLKNYIKRKELSDFEIMRKFI